MKCDACGAPIENGVCTYCGKKFPLTEAKSTAPSKEESVTVNAKIIFADEPETEPINESPKTDSLWKKSSFWKKVGIVLLWVYFFPIMLTIYIYRRRDLSKKTKTTILGVLWGAVLVFTIISGFLGDDLEVPEDQESATSGNQIITMENADGSKQPGEISVFYPSEEHPAPDLEDWFFGYVLKNDYRYCLILDLESKPLEGTVATRYGIEKGTRLLRVGDGYYKLYDDDVEYYTANAASKVLEEGYPLNKYNAEVIGRVEKADALIPSEYKGAKYSAKIFGMEQHPQLSLTLENTGFTDKECQQFLENVVPKLKEKIPDLTYLVVLFQTDDSSLFAIGTVDDVSAYSNREDIHFNLL